MTREVIPVVLSGGSGTRLWPLSRELRPKQFLPLVGTQSLFQETLLRLQGFRSAVRAPVIVCNEDHRFLVAEQLREIDVAPQAILLEPEGRNTGPAVTAAALVAMDALAGDDGALLLVLPADHVILGGASFADAVETAVDAALGGYLVTFGVVPTKPETGYGYILCGADRDGWSVLDKFVEKPDLSTAREYLSSGRYLWNSGMFVFSAGAWLHELARHAPRIVDICRQAVKDATVDRDFMRLSSAFLDCPSDSIDYAVMEKTSKAAVVSLDAGWSDVGSWAALHEVLDKDSEGNILRGDVILDACRDSYVASTSRLVAALGLDGVIVVETGDAVVVMARERSQDVKRIVDALKTQNRVEVRTAHDAAPED